MLTDPGRQVTATTPRASRYARALSTRLGKKGLELHRHEDGGWEIRCHVETLQAVSDFATRYERGVRREDQPCTDPIDEP